MENKRLRIDENSSLTENIFSLYSFLVENHNNLSPETSKDYLATLNKLNLALSSRFIDDSEGNDEFFYYVGIANFKVHNYELAQQFLKKSIRLESRIEQPNYDLGYKKRLYCCYCLEYSSSVLANKDCDNNLEKAIFALVGDKINIKDIPRGPSAINKISELYNRECNSCQELLKVICGEDCEGESLYSYVLSYIEVSNRGKYLEELCHVLAHCLSEYARGKKLIYFQRLSEMFMRLLGDDYITCLATLLAEKKDFVSAFKEMNRVKTKYVTRLDEAYANGDKEEEERIKREIAQINYYGWYFSCLSKYSDAQVWKEEFKSYCEESKDKNAIVYYELLNIKEAYQKGFDNIKKHISRGSKLINCVKEAYETFNLVQPSISVFKEIEEEWKFLKSLYNIYLECLGIMGEHSSASMFNLSVDTLFDENMEIKKHVESRSHNCGEKVYCETHIGSAQFIYKGDKKLLEDVLAHLKLDGYYSIKPKPDKIIQGDIEQENADNFLICFSDRYYDEEIDILKKLLEHNSKNIYKREICKNIFIDTSKISLKRRAEINALCSYADVLIINNTRSSVMTCVMFARIEDIIKKINRELSSFVIAPIDDSQSYSWQSENSLKQFDNVSNIGITDWSQNWKDYLIACYPSVNSQTNYRKEIQLNIDKDETLSAVVYFDFDSTPGAEKLSVYLFDIESEVYVADRVLISNRQFYDELQLIFSREKRSINYRHCHGDCELDSCPSVSFNLDNTNNNYGGLRDYLLSYFGTDIFKKRFVLIRMLNDGNQFALFLYNEIPSDDTTKNVCRLLRTTQVFKNYEGGVKMPTIVPLSDMIGTLSKQYGKEMLKDNEYIFISYRGKKGARHLCAPVYEDALKHWNLIKNEELIQCVIDKAYFDTDFDNLIKKYILNEKCIGAFVYLSKEYFENCEDGDRCLEEIELINKRYAENPKFIKLPIFIEHSIDDNNLANGFANVDDFMKYIMFTLKRYKGYYSEIPLDDKRKSFSKYYKKDERRYKAFSEFFHTEADEVDLHICVEKWDKDLNYIAKPNFVEELKKGGITIVRK